MMIFFIGLSDFESTKICIIFVIMNNVLEDALAISGQVARWRRWLHRHAELSFEEHATARFIMDTLRLEGIECRPVAGTGVLAWVGEGREAVVLRADIDALPVEEATGLECTSENQGIMHACGHDMHAAALLGAMVLLKRRGVPHTVFGLFQPGEELLPGGATKVLAEDPFGDYDVRAFYGQHVDPELPVGTFGVREGAYMASTDELHIEVRGVGGHGAMRSMLKDPVQAAAALITSLLDLGNTPDSVLSIGRVEADGATNVVPDTVQIKGTLRTFDEGLRASLRQAVERAGAAVAERFGVSVAAEVRHGYPSVVNAAAPARHAMQKLAEIGTVVALERRMTGEDFGFYTRRYPSLFYRFGVGTAAGRLHTRTFNPDEEALSYAVAGLVALAL
jgi:amidohydrolase